MQFPYSATWKGEILWNGRMTPEGLDFSSQPNQSSGFSAKGMSQLPDVHDNVNIKYKHLSGILKKQLKFTVKYST